MFEKLEIEKWLELNAKLQQKKNALRSDLKARGILKKGKTNDFDHYNYFSEAQYKELFTGLFSEHNLELKFTEEDYGMFDTNSDKQPNGRLPRLEFTLFDCETGFGESTTITGEAIDKGDKAGYKAYTGALKYYLSNTFMVATGDDPEIESPEARGNNKKPSFKKPTPKKEETVKPIDLDDNLMREVLAFTTIDKIKKYYKTEDITNEHLQKTLDLYNHTRGNTND